MQLALKFRRYLEVSQDPRQLPIGTMFPGLGVDHEGPSDQNSRILQALGNLKLIGSPIPGVTWTTGAKLISSMHWYFHRFFQAYGIRREDYRLIKPTYRSCLRRSSTCN